MSKTTRAAQNDLRAKRRETIGRIGHSHRTEFGGAAVIVAYSKATNRYQSASGLWWQLAGGVMVTPVEDRKNA
jgi:hypothetical protein